MIIALTSYTTKQKRLVNVDNIFYIQEELNGTKLLSVDDKWLLVSESIDEIESIIFNATNPQPKAAPLEII